MRTRRRILIALGILLLAAGLVGSIRSGRGSPGVVLVFAGFTNKTVMNEAEREIKILPVAQMLATNMGNVPVGLHRWYAGVRPGSLSTRGFVSPGWSQATHWLRPGESLLIEVGPGDFSSPWWTGLSYQRHGLREKLCIRTFRFGGAPLRKLLGPGWLSKQLFLSAESGWITNQAPPTQTMPSLYLPPGSWRNPFQLP